MSDHRTSRGRRPGEGAPAPRPRSRRRARGAAARGAVLVLLAAALAAPPGAASGPELTLSVAISMKDAVDAIGRTFAARHPGVALHYNLGASGELQRQIEAGAPVDVFVSAGAREMDELERQGLILAGTRRAFARNALVVIEPAGPGRGLAALADLAGPHVGRIAIGDPRTVPAGRYAQESLRAAGLGERLAPRLVLAGNVRQVLAYVARGEVDAGFVYATDVAAAGARVRVAFRPGADTYPAVVYPAAVVAASRQPALAGAFVELLVSAEGQAVLARLGFDRPAS